MKEKLLKGFDFIAEGLWNQLLYPVLMWFLIITTFCFLIVGLMLLTAMLGIADYETMRNTLLEFTQKPWW